MTVQPQPQQKQDLSFRIFSLMTRLNIEASPVNYELFHEIMSGNNPELRERFSKLGKAINNEAIAELARRYLPHHFGDSIFDTSSKTMSKDLEELMASLERSHSDLDTFTQHLSKSTDKFKSIDPANANEIKAELDGLAKATDYQRSLNQATLTTINTKLTSVNTLASEIDEVERAKFTHPATGLSNRRAFNKRMATMFADAKFPGDYALCFGRISHFEAMEKAELLKAKEYLLKQIGITISGVVSEDDFGGWIESPQICIILATASESEIKRICGNVRQKLDALLANMRRTSPLVPSCNTFFGACTTYGASNAATMIGNAEKALIKAAERADGEIQIFGETGTDADSGKNYQMYGSISV